MNSHPAIKLLALLGAVLVSGICWQGEAKAQGFPCSGAPGERQIGMAGGGPGVAPFPICVNDGAASGPAGPATVYITYAAFAWHPDAADVWVKGNRLTKGEAIDGALAECGKIMGSGCEQYHFWNAAAFVMRDREGNIYTGYDGEPNSLTGVFFGSLTNEMGKGSERPKALADCSSNQLLPCEILDVYNSETKSHRPTGNPRKAYAAAAWVADADAFDEKLYIASGHANRESAMDAATKACITANQGQQCAITARSANGFIQAIALDSGSAVTVETSIKRLKQAAQLLCQKNKSKKCDLQAVFDSRKAGLFVHDFGSEGGT